MESLIESTAVGARRKTRGESTRERGDCQSLAAQGIRLKHRVLIAGTSRRARHQQRPGDGLRRRRRGTAGTVVRRRWGPYCEEGGCLVFSLDLTAVYEGRRQVWLRIVCQPCLIGGVQRGYPASVEGLGVSPTSVRVGGKPRCAGDLTGWQKREAGGDRGTRTPNLRIANAALSQLSYIPMPAATAPGKPGGAGTYYSIGLARSGSKGATACNPAPRPRSAPPCVLPPFATMTPAFPRSSVGRAVGC